MTCDIDMSGSEPRDMREGKTSISNAASYEDMADFWDARDSADYWDEVPSAEFDIDADAQAVYYPLNMSLAMACARSLNNGAYAQRRCSLSGFGKGWRRNPHGKRRLART